MHCRYKGTQPKMAVPLGVLSSLLNFGHASFGGKLLKLESVVAGHDAVHRSGKIDHPRLGGDIGRMIGLAEGGAGQVRRQIAIEITIVRSQDERRISVHPEILRSISVP